MNQSIIARIVTLNSATLYAYLASAPLTLSYPKLAQETTSATELYQDMNLLILETEQLLDEQTALANPRQTQHIDKVLRLADGDRIQVGLVNGNMGYGQAVRSTRGIEIRHMLLTTPPPPQLPLTILLGMPRPQMLKRILQTVACLGVRQLVFFQSARVEKSFWQSPSATEAAIKDQLLLGLEQGVATQLPIVRQYQRFRPFIEDVVPTMVRQGNALIAHPGGAALAAPSADKQREMVIAVGPEGGFMDQEVEQFIKLGFMSVHLGKRILKVETAVPVLIAKLFEF